MSRKMTKWALVGVLTLSFALAGTMSVVSDKSEMSGKSTLKPCVTEDSDNCYWNAAKRANGKGRSFYRVAGKTYYTS